MSTEDYPRTRRVDQVDDYHGVEVSDPYRWLEEDARVSEEVAAWVAAQGALTRGVLDAIPAREPLRRRMTALWDRPRVGLPARAGGRYLHYHADPGQEQMVLYVRDRLEDTPRVLLDPNEWSEDGTISLGGTSVSRDGRYLAYAVSESGSDWRVIRVLEIDTGRLLPDEIKWSKSDVFPWSADGAGFYYSRHPEPAPGTEFQVLALNQTLHFHRLGDRQEDDALVLARPDEPHWSFYPQLTHDGAWLVVNVYKDNPSENAVMVRRVGDEGDFAHLLPPFEDRSMVLGNDGAVFYVQTNRGAPNGRIVAIDLEAGGPWRTLIPEAPQAIDNASLISDRFVLRYLVDCLPAVKIFDLSGALEREVSFPDVGTLGTRSSSFEGRRDHTETFYSFQAPARPPEIYRYDLTTGEHTLLHRAAVDIDLDRFVTRQVFFKSRDGARVPMFLTHLRGLKLDGSNPTLLMGYGGFNITYDPYFNTALLPWFELGGVLAQANLRGGSEYGEAWHRAGMREKKQNVFDDFIAAAEHLIAQGYTAPARLASRGNSNGGLLVGATMLQRPDLFGACLPATGVMDMLRYQRFTSGKYWVGEYGASSDPEMFPVLRAYSPVHNVDPEAAYPPCMVMTADTDDRVVPGHSFKFAAALQAASGGPCYLRVTTRAGHGAGMSLSQTIEEWADCLAFLVDRFGLELPEHLR